MSRHLINGGMVGLLLLAVGVLAPAAAASPADVVTWACQGWQQEVRELAERYRDQLVIESGFVTTGEVPSEPSSRPLRIAYYRVRPRLFLRWQIALPPVLYFNGGPAESSHDELRDFLGLGASSSRASDTTKLPFFFELVFFDQRGTGCSTPYPRVSRSDLSPIAHYGAQAIVQDAELIRVRILGNRKVIAFGASYGGLLAHQYLLRYPDAVASTVSEAYAAYGERLLDYQIRHELKQQQQYFRRFPGDEATLKRLGRQIPTALCLQSQDERVCGPEILDLLGLALMADRWDELHDIISRLDERLREGDLAAGLQEQLLPALAALHDDKYRTDFERLGIHLAINRIDFGNLDMRASLKRMSLAGLDLGSIPMLEARWKARIDARTDRFYHFGSLPETQPLTAETFAARLPPGERLTLVAHENDATVPVEAVFDEKNLLGQRAEVIVIPSVGHDFVVSWRVFAELVQANAEPRFPAYPARLLQRAEQRLAIARGASSPADYAARTHGLSLIEVDANLLGDKGHSPDLYATRSEADVLVGVKLMADALEHYLDAAPARVSPAALFLTWYGLDRQLGAIELDSPALRSRYQTLRRRTLARLGISSAFASD